MKTLLTPELYQYAEQIAPKEHPVLALLREKTSAMTGAHMQITSNQGKFMAMLTKILLAKKYLEIGVYTGYSTLAVTLALPNDGQAFALDINNETMKIAKEYWAMAGVQNKITSIIGNAVDSLAKLVDDGHSASFDIAFIDARKSDYIEYFNYCYQLIKAGGIILIDNVFMSGEVLKPDESNAGNSVNQFNIFLQNSNLDYCVTTIADGLTIVRKT